MDTEQQQLDTLITAFRDKAPPAPIEPLATPSVLRIADSDDKRALHWALELHEDPEVMELLVSSDPTALLAVLGGKAIWSWFENYLHAENRFSNHDEILDLLSECYYDFKEHRFSRLIELCGTSDALEALVAAHDEDNLSLHVLCIRESWDKVPARIKQLPPQDAVDELFLPGRAWCHCAWCRVLL